MPQAFDETPALPPDVKASMGAGGGDDKAPFSGVGKMMAGQKPGGATPGGADPTGAIQQAGEAVEKVIDNMATMSEAFKPFANRIKQFLQAGIAEAAKAGQTGKPAPPPGGPQASAKAPEGPGMMTFPG